MRSLKAKYLPKHLGPAAWNAILGPNASYPALGEEITADVTIIGAGFAGCSAARRLLQLDPTLKIVLLDADGIAEGSNGRNSGFMVDLPHALTSDDYAGHGDDRLLTDLNRHAIAFAQEAVHDYGIDPNYFDRSGKINGAGGPKADAANHSYARHLDKLGEAYELYDQRTMQEITGSRHYLSGLYTPGTVTLQPAGYIRGVIKGLAPHVSVFERTPALSFVKSGTSWRVTTPKGAITTPRVIMATNGHLESFGFERGRLMHVFLFASMTRPLSDDEQRRLGGRPRWGVTPSDPMGTTLRRIDTAQGGERIVTRTYAALRSDMSARPRDLERAARLHLRKFEMHFPHLAHVEQEFKWSGHLCLSKNDASVAREVEDGVFAACVQNGLGTTRGTLTGIAAAELALGYESNITQFFAAQEALTKLPPEPFRGMGANVYLQWRTWQAMSE